MQLVHLHVQAGRLVLVVHGLVLVERKLPDREPVLLGGFLEVLDEVLVLARHKLPLGVPIHKARLVAPPQDGHRVQAELTVLHDLDGGPGHDGGAHGGGAGGVLSPVVLVVAAHAPLPPRPVLATVRRYLAPHTGVVRYPVLLRVLGHDGHQCDEVLAVVELNVPHLLSREHVVQRTHHQVAPLLALVGLLHLCLLRVAGCQGLQLLLNLAHTLLDVAHNLLQGPPVRVACVLPHKVLQVVLRGLVVHEQCVLLALVDLHVLALNLAHRILASHVDLGEVITQRNK
mmetsp:Transcript_7673/g.11681  ORF Transcript_7673/g.11681 Transcript_7673/m.11681 type:complete len:286 (+) Transcript_7673:420-1277(+)